MNNVYNFRSLPDGPTDEEVDAALARLAPGVHAWSPDERHAMRAILEAPDDEAALLAWRRPSDGSLLNVTLAAIRAVREAYAWGRGAS